MGRWIGSGFRGSPSLSRVSVLPCWRCVAGVIVRQDTVIASAKIQIRLDR